MDGAAADADRRCPDRPVLAPGWATAPPISLTWEYPQSAGSSTGAAAIRRRLDFLKGSHILADTPRWPSVAASSAGLPLGGMWAMARSASAVIVRAGLTPTLAGTAAPSQTSRFW